MSIEYKDDEVLRLQKDLAEARKENQAMKVLIDAMDHMLVEHLEKVREMMKGKGNNPNE